MKKRCLAIALCFLLLPALTGCVSDLLVEKESTGDTLPDVRPALPRPWATASPIAGSARCSIFPTRS